MQIYALFSFSSSPEQKTPCTFCYVQIYLKCAIFIQLSEVCIYPCNIANVKEKACQTGKYAIQPPLFSTNYKRPITGSVPILRNHLE